MALLENPSLFQTMEKALFNRQRSGIMVRDISKPMPSSLPDLFSNDYLSLATNHHLRHAVIERLNKAPYILGTSGSRVLSGNPSQFILLEKRMQEYWDAPSALLCNSGFDANLAFFSSVPQNTDAVIYDELIHASIIGGLKASRACSALFPFSHNSPTSLRERILHVLASKPNILAGHGTLFISLESAYSMDGDFAPLPDIIAVVEELVPAGAFHIFVDEAHTTGLCGMKGKGFISMLGLEHRVHTVLHTFGKGYGFCGAVILTHPSIKMYLTNYARPIMYSTSLPHCNIESLHAIFDFLSSPAGDQLRNDLYSNATYFESRLRSALSINDQTLLTLPQSSPFPGLPQGFASPIFPVLTPKVIPLARYLQSLGYDAQPISFPAVPKGTDRVRIIVHAANSQKDLDGIIGHLLEWLRLNSLEDDPERKGVNAHFSVDKDISFKVNVHTNGGTDASPKNVVGHCLMREFISPFPESLQV